MTHEQDIQKYKPRALRGGLVMDRGAVKAAAGKELRHLAGQVRALIEELQQYRPSKGEQQYSKQYTMHTTCASMVQGSDLPCCAASTLPKRHSQDLRKGLPTAAARSRTQPARHVCALTCGLVCPRLPARLPVQWSATLWRCPWSSRRVAVWFGLLGGARPASCAQAPQESGIGVLQGVLSCVVRRALGSQRSFMPTTWHGFAKCR
jgi:hypothetical protein